MSNVRRRHPLVTSGSEAFCDTLFTFADLPVLLTRPHDWALPIAAAVLRGAQHPEPEVAEITFNFWYLLSEQVAGGGRMLVEDRQTVKALFAPLYLDVVDSLRKQVELPDDSDAWTADMQDDFKRFRYAVGDAIFDSCKVASSVAVRVASPNVAPHRLPEANRVCVIFIRVRDHRCHACCVTGHHQARHDAATEASRVCVPPAAALAQDRGIHLLPPPIHLDERSDFL